MRTIAPNIDLRPDHWVIVRSALQQHVPDREVLAFGSRATWTAKEYSDLDLAIMGEEPLSLRASSALAEAFGESDLPFKVDVVDWARTDDSFRAIIRRDGVAVQELPKIPDLFRPTLSEDWGIIPFADAFLINPAVPIERGRPTPFVDMAAVDPARRTVRSTSVREFRGSGSRFQNGDTLFARITPCLENGKIARYYATSGLGDIAHGSTEFIVVRGRPGVTDSEYAFYATRSDLVREYAIGQMTGTPGRQRVPTYTLAHLDVPLPSLPEQRAIAYILGTLDDKIELNRRMNETLEAMARCLFKSWFVDFDPVRVKMEGRDTGLPQDIADLFPDRLVDSELGEIPEGWEVRPLTDTIELLTGGTPKTSVADYWNGSIPWYTPRDAPNQCDVFVLDTQRKITQAGVDNSATKVLPVRTTIISARGTVGRLACLGRSMAMNQTCYGIRGVSGYQEFFTYWRVRSTLEELRSRTHGTVFDTITRKTFTFVDLHMPPVDIVGAFESAVGPIMERILSNLHEARTLAALRDTLLPKLMSGEIRVPDATRALESVT